MDSLSIATNRRKKILRPPDERPLSHAELAHFQAYLPPNLIKLLQVEMHAPSRRLLARCLAHLTSLLSATTSHLPASLEKQIQRNATPGQADGQFVDGTLLFADISGFTAMSEKLSRSGREGAEEVTAIVNRYFDVMLDILRRHEGQLIRFGGDALLGLFAERPFSAAAPLFDLPDLPEQTDSATRAVQAAMAMQDAMSRFTQTQTSQGTFPLRMSVGVHKGRFFAAQLGNQDNMEYALFGQDVNDAAAAESIATAGQVVLNQQTLDAVDPNVWCAASPIPDQDEYLVIQHISPQASPPSQVFHDTHFPLPPTLPVLRRTVRLLDVFTPFLPVGLLLRLNSDPDAPSLKGEPRPVASLFANVDGLGEMADRLGPGNEALIISVLNQYFLRMSDAVRRYGGVINKIDLYDHGDKLLITFGAPVTHEDDPERAVQAALAMQVALEALNDALPEQTGLPDLFLRQRIGISYGSVFAGFVGASWRHEYTVMGDEVNLAARLMSAADSHQIVVGQNVWRKARATAEFTLRGEVQLKGKSQPISIYEVTGLKSAPEQGRGLQGLTSALVGRDDERVQLHNLFMRLIRGQGGIMAVSGEAGLGKSRLVRDALPSGVRTYRSRCLSYTESVSYRPFQDIVRQMVNLSVEEDDEVALPLLKAALAKWLTRETADDHLPYVANFLNMPLPEAWQAKVRYLDGEALQQRTFVALHQLFAAQSAAEPLIVMLDDIHWMDRASLDMLAHLLPLATQLPIVWLLLYRPMHDKPYQHVCDEAARRMQAHYQGLHLPGLSRAESQQLLFNLIPLDEWPAGVVDLILDRAEGNPLFLEEVLRSLINDDLLGQGENGRWRFSQQIAAITVPDTLEGVLLARLDRLEELVRRTVQVASVVGRSFPLDVLSGVMVGSVERPLHTHISRLKQVEIIRELQRRPELLYAFMHTLMQEVSYSSLSATSRREYHRLIAVYLEDSRSAGWGNIESLPPLIAHHAFAGQDWPRALHYQMMAGRQAQQLFANHEAIDHFEKALHCAGQLEATTADQMQIHLALSQLFIATGKYEDAKGHLARADLLAKAADDNVAETAVCRRQVRLHELQGAYDKALQWVQRGLAITTQVETAEYTQILLLAGLINIRQGKFDAAYAHCQTALDIGHRLGEVTVLARAHNLLGITYLRSSSTAAIENFHKAYALYQQAGDLQGQATSHNLIANACFNLGQWQEADDHYRQAQQMFAQIGDVYNQAIADNNLGGIARSRGQLDEAFHFYHEGLRLAERVGGSGWMVGVFHMNLGAAFVRKRDAASAIRHLQAGADHFEKAGSREFLPEMKRHWAEAALVAGDLAKARLLAEEALALARAQAMRDEEGCCLAVLGRIALVQADGVYAQAEAFLLESVEVLETVANEYELARSRFDLARVWAAMGNMASARQQLTQAATVFSRLEAVLDKTAVFHLQEKLKKPS